MRIFHLSFAHALTPWGEPRGRLPEAERPAPGSAGGPRRGGRAAAEVRRLPGGHGVRSQTPELWQPWERVGEECR